jgi:hypothetical protein
MVHARIAAASLLTLAIALLVPTAGLMTLPIPDGIPTPSLEWIADYSHGEKKTSIIELHAFVPVVRSALSVVFVSTAILLLLVLVLFIRLRSSIQVRAPPSRRIA